MSSVLLRLQKYLLYNNLLQRLHAQIYLPEIYYDNSQYAKKFGIDSGTSHNNDK